MSNEYMQHLQCQTCFVHFPTNQELVLHIEEYRSEERLLVAKLERIRLHLPQSCDISSSDNDDNDNDGEDDIDKPTAPDQLRCPFRPCERVEPFTTRANLIRHFQKHVQCFEMCPYCYEIISQVHRFVRHDCKVPSDKPKDMYMQHRFTQLYKMVNKELDSLQSPPSYTRKRAYRVVESSPIRAQKRVMTSQVSILPANTYLQTHLSVAGSIITDDELTSTSEMIKVTATNNTDGTFAQAATISPSNNAELIFPSKTTIDIPRNAGEWAFAAPTMPTNDSSWGYAQTVSAMPANDGSWAFAETAPVIPANEDGWAFAETAPAISANDDRWAFTETVE